MLLTNWAHRSATDCVPVYRPQSHKFDPRLDPTKEFNKCWYWETTTSKSPVVAHTQGRIGHSSQSTDLH
ncbi:unnamed protein product [Caenorhabditis auriculariae]|uniref:Uncharacterized protein n=1 Tax=Caenorhabditis auriculariae TaxID=2777116 RepID=A0A8S1H2P1_9PELO|nr:unnamed protein product [Caenorhabditis auriculariae]